MTYSLGLLEQRHYRGSILHNKIVFLTVLRLEEFKGKVDNDLVPGEVPLPDLPSEHLLALFSAMEEKERKGNFSCFFLQDQPIPL